MPSPDEQILEPPPENCPGPSSEAAGKLDSCAGCPNQSVCASGAAAVVDPAIAEIGSGLSVQHKLLILSGKGGVGKSTFTSQLAWALSADSETDVGLLDVDICGPSIPTMFQVEGETVHSSNEGWAPVYVRDNLCLMSIGFMLEEQDDAIIWRGPKKNGSIHVALLQFQNSHTRSAQA